MLQPQIQRNSWQRDPFPLVGLFLPLSVKWGRAACPPEGVRSQVRGAGTGGPRPAASRPPRLPVGLGANRTRTATPGSVPRLASRCPGERPKAARGLPGCSSLLRSTAMGGGLTHVRVSVHHFRELLPANPFPPQQAQPRPLKAQAACLRAHAPLHGCGPSRPLGGRVRRVGDCPGPPPSAPES